MLISCNKLKTYIKDSEKIDWLKVWNKFTIRTAEVENVKEVGDKFDGVVIAQIVECIPHPDSDHMHILKVNYGASEPIQVVCGAYNVRVGLKTAYIKVGGHIDGIEIKAKPLRGILSNGMCCSMRELGIGDDHDGIIELPDDVVVGTDIKDYLPVKDIIVEIDNKSLTNRPDLWGHYGIAREIATITHTEMLPLEMEEIKNDKDILDIKINNPELCYRYTGLKIDNIKNNKSPLELQIFLYYTGMRSISLIVDLTNYLMLELGQPMHAFDSRVVKNIEVGLANNKDLFTTLDGVERKLSSENLMIKNNNEYFAIAGVMGGKNSEILSDTTSIFLESATFNAGSVRKTANFLGLRTDASARYEKSLDPNMTDKAIKRLVYLLRKENPDMQIASNLTDVYPNVLNEVNITLHKDLLSKYMGTTLSDESVINTLESLGFKVENTDYSYEVVVPTFRHSKDINIEEDLIEEIARIYGLENFTPKPLKLDLTITEHETTFNEEYEVKSLLATKYDMNEVNSYIWYDTNTLQTLGIKKDGVKLLGKSDNNILRDDLSFSLLNIVEENFKNFSEFSIFEIGTIIKDNLNKRVLSIILCGKEKELEQLYNKAKTVTSYIFKALKHKEITLSNNVNEKEYYDKKLGKIINVDDTKIGTINVLDKIYTNKLSKKKAIVCIDIDFDKYAKLEKDIILEKVVSKYPNVELDYTIIMPTDKKYEDLKEVLKEFKSKLIERNELVSIYENKYTIKYVLGSPYKTLEQKDLQTFKERFIAHLKENGYSINE
jgi:phenylalanyl-tRNA synthetase beta chain